MEIYKKIGDILKEVAPIAKDRKNTQQNYNFRGIEDATNMLQPLLAKYGVFPATENIEQVSSEAVQSKSGSAGYHYVNRYTFHFYAEDGSFVKTMADGEAIDYGDKSSNKAYSTAYREALWKLFIVPFEADDTENTSHDLKPKNEPTVQSAPKNAPNATVAPKKTPFETASEKISKATTAEELAELSAKVNESVKLTEEQKADLQDSIEARASFIK